MIKRRDLVSLIGSVAAAWPILGHAQQPTKVYRIGFLALGIGPSTPMAEAFRERIREHGYVEARNVALDYRFAQGQADRLDSMAAELIDRRVDVIVTESTPAAVAAKRATSTIPIVMAVGSDPVAAGLVASLSRPGGNVTGITNIPSQLMGKRLELLKQIAPTAAIVGVVWNSSNSTARSYLKETVTAATALGLQLAIAEARGPSDLDAAFAALIRGRAAALINLPDGMIWNNRKRLVDFALSHGIPSVFDAREFAEVGGLVAYGPSLVTMFRRSADYVDKVLRGADAANLPIELPTKFELSINLKTAKRLGISMPETILVQADEVIE
jgi:putative tryptophan/tyrosine transport system substrate-binding protein